MQNKNIPLNNDIINELGTNFIEYAVAVNTDRAIPNATDGLKPVAKRIIYTTFDCGFKSDKPHVKCANIVGNVMAYFHPHGDSSIYGALVRLSQNWVMRYPLIDFHGANGNIDGDGPAAYRYTEARLSKLAEDGLLAGIKKENVDFIPNFSENKMEPVELPAIFPNLLCNPNSGIGVAMASSWAPHNLREVAQAIYDYMDGKEPMLPGPDFPTGGIIINKNDIPAIMRTGHGSVKIRGKYEITKNQIIFTEIPYGTNTETLMTQIGTACDNEEITGITNIRNESNKNGLRLVISCDKNASPDKIVNKLFAKTNLQSTFSYNQVALVDKTPTELNLKQYIKIYIDYNSKCITRECLFDIKRAKDRIHIIEGLLTALNDIDNVIYLIKNSESSSVAKQKLIEKYNFDEEQAKAILDMKLAKLAKLERVDLEQERDKLLALVAQLEEICANPVPELRKRLSTIVSKYGDARRTELTQLVIPKEEKDIAYVEPEKCVVIATEAGTLKRIPVDNFKIQRRGGKGIKTQEDITSAIIRTNTIDSLMIFSDKGTMYRLIVDNIPIGTNTSRGISASSLVQMAPNENLATIYSIYRDTDAEYVLFATKNGLLKKTKLSEYTNVVKKTGINAIKIKENDELASVSLVKNENLLLITKNGYCIKIQASDITPSGRNTSGVIGIRMAEDDELLTVLPIRDATDNLAVFTSTGYGKRVELKEISLQNRGGKGVMIVPKGVKVAACQLVNDKDTILLVSENNSICLDCNEIPLMLRTAQGNIMQKSGNITSVSKV